MKVSGDFAPPGAFSIEAQPGMPGQVCVRLYENAREVAPHWEYDEYHLVVPMRDDLAADLEENYADWLLTAKGMEHPRDALTTEERERSLSYEGLKQAYALSEATGSPPPADIGILVSGAEPFEFGRKYAQWEPFSYNGAIGCAKQEHTSSEAWIPFSVGTEALYGARPEPDAAGVYPYVYNMAADVGMRVRDNEGVVWVCYNPIYDNFIFPPGELSAHFRKDE